ncbi:hypothetical protein AEA09_05850 [Lysinibacillus contaminans]|uniref:Uncharacterized protein n=1 Tax=Lysinibacillus contaminans TaxID=1293441 RepID=A0ABR5K006_9BACI|nr:hypothetical protein [Lysinibacillus contaminans]KOS68123.1 hypothetical protein AEA09_05850 [Lysinibacillus contaminans]
MNTKYQYSRLSEKYKKAYIKLLTIAAANNAKQVDAYFFGEDSELRYWHYGSTALYIAIEFFVFVAIN